GGSHDLFFGNGVGVARAEIIDVKGIILGELVKPCEDKFITAWIKKIIARVTRKNRIAFLAWPAIGSGNTEPRDALFHGFHLGILVGFGIVNHWNVDVYLWNN